MSRVRLCLLVLGVLALAGRGADAALSFSGRPFSAYVIDAESGAPVPGAAIVAIWALERGRALHGTDYKTLTRVETTTDREGRFDVAGWGPKIAFPTWKMSNRSPAVYVLKPGYRYEVADRYHVAYPALKCFRPHGGRASAPAANGASGAPRETCDLHLGRPDRSPQDYASSLAVVQRELCSDRTSGACGGAVRAYFDAEKARLVALGATWPAD